MIFQQLLSNSCWDYKCIINSQIYDMLTFNDTINGIFLWSLYLLAPFGVYGVINISHKVIRRIFRLC